MKIVCENCNGTNKGRYSTFFFSGKLITLCDECRWGTGVKSSANKDKRMEEHISTPFWLHMGLKPNAKEKAELRYLKDHNLSWSDYRKMRNLGAKNPGSYKQFEKFVNSGGKEKDVSFTKTS